MDIWVVPPSALPPSFVICFEVGAHTYMLAGLKGGRGAWAEISTAGVIGMSWGNEVRFLLPR